MSTEVDTLRAELDHERAKVRALQEIGLALGTTLDLDALLNIVVERISDVMSAERSTLYLLDELRGELCSRVAQGNLVEEIRLKVGEGISGSVAATGKAARIGDVYTDPRFKPDWDQRTGFRTKSVLCVPMQNQHGKRVGVLQVLNKREGTFSHEDEALAQALAGQIVVSIENSKLFRSMAQKNEELLDAHERLAHKIRELDLLFEIAQVAAGAQELDELLDGVLERTMRAIDAEAGSVLVAEEKTGDLLFRAAAGGRPDAVRKVRIPAGQGICGWVAHHGEAVVVNDAAVDERHSASVAEAVGYRPRSVLCVPLVWDNGRGALELLNKAGGGASFTEADVKLATLIAGHVSTAVGLAQNRERRAQQDRLSSIGQFLSGVLHDLKTPMSVIFGYVQLLAREESPDQRKHYSALITRQVDLINAMTRETLAFARGDRELWVRKVYLHKFFEDIADQMRRELEQRHIRFQLDLRDRGVAYFDAAKVQRTIHNLARNAAEAIGGKGGTFTIRVERASDGALVLAFTDDGPGVPIEIRDSLFESFTTHGKKGNTGLGLAIVKTIVEDHGGSIRLESQPGKTTFTLTFPQKAKAELEAKAES